MSSLLLDESGGRDVHVELEGPWTETATSTRQCAPGQERRTICPTTFGAALAIGDYGRHYGHPSLGASGAAEPAEITVMHVVKGHTSLRCPLHGTPNVMCSRNVSHGGTSPSLCVARTSVRSRQAHPRLHLLPSPQWCQLGVALGSAVIGTRSVSKSSMNCSERYRSCHSSSSRVRTHLLVKHPDLDARISPVLLQYTAQSPSLQLAIAAHDGAGPMSAHVAAYQGGERSWLQQQ